jgi:hypothetical protein
MFGVKPITVFWWGFAFSMGLWTAGLVESGLSAAIMRILYKVAEYSI